MRFVTICMPLLQYLNTTVLPPSLADTEVDCKQCESVLEGMEAIDDEAEAAGIPVVKVH